MQKWGASLMGSLKPLLSVVEPLLAPVDEPVFFSLIAIVEAPVIDLEFGLL